MRTLTVLVVDDDDADTLMIVEALQTATVPPIVHRAVDGQEALDFLRRRGPFAEAVRPDLVLLDLNMPRVSGHEVLAEVKSDPELRAIPVVVLTTSDAAADIIGSYGEHANAYVNKPMDLDSFEAVVQTINDFYSEVAVLPD
ncbi:response regulator [Actinoplanes sp. L3-i22]|uniref:response regulator n=1 Tax=Actinoplanes sp. L3-i22 TaxID=2836373 RepID=UPI001C785C72|nr:response regulator [Actinoplanes sp. L3-i22]BCY09260.1 two-component system response regulator [Actinoplanes sp. L3-i22]